jgi:hypothetical protein
VNKTVTEKFNLQPFRARIRLFRLARDNQGTRYCMHVCVIYGNVRICIAPAS